MKREMWSYQVMFCVLNKTTPFKQLPLPDYDFGVFGFNI